MTAQEMVDRASYWLKSGRIELEIYQDLLAALEQARREPCDLTRGQVETTFIEAQVLAGA